METCTGFCGHLVSKHLKYLNKNVVSRNYKLEVCSLYPPCFMLSSLTVSPCRLADLHASFADPLSQGVITVIPKVSGVLPQTFHCHKTKSTMPVIGSLLQDKFLAWADIHTNMMSPSFQLNNHYLCFAVGPQHYLCVTKYWHPC